MKQLRLFLLLISLFSYTAGKCQQSYNFSSGAIPMCDTSYFTSSVSGIGTLYPYNWGNYWNYSISTLLINITSNHPQTLQISLTSPQGTTLLLSAFNGNGGVNYTNCTFDISASNNITTGTAPFSGYWIPQGGSFSVFDWENGDGIWTITIIDTACSGGGGGGGGGGGAWTPGYFNGGGSGGVFGFVPSGPPPPPPPMPINLNPISMDVCPGQSIDITSQLSQGALFTYTYNGNMVSNPNAVTQPGVYSAEYLDWNLYVIYYVTITVNSLPSPALGLDQTVSISCSGTSIDLNTILLTASYTMSWNLNGNPISASQASNCTTPGYYQAIAINGSGCTDTAYVTVNGAGTITLGANQSAVVCSNSSLDLTALYNTSGYTCAWSLNNLPVINPAAVNASGNYQLIASSGGCADTAFVNVISNPAPALGTNQTINACNLFPFDLNSMFNLSGLTADWTIAGAPVANPSAVTVSGVYELIATDNNVCTDTALASINQFASPNLGTDQTTSSCSNVDINLTTFFNTSGLTSAWFYNGSSTLTPAAVSASGVYTLVATNGSGCTDTANITLQSNAAPYLGSDQAVSVCPGILIDLTSLFNSSGLTTSWSSNNIPVANPMSVSQSGTYQLIVSDANSCEDTALVQLNNLPTPALGNDQQAHICDGSSIDLTSLYNTVGLSTAWSVSGAAVTFPQQITAAGNYQLIATNGSGCNDTAIVALTVDPLPVVGAPATVSICQGETADLTQLFLTNGYSTSWTINGIPVANPVAVTAAGLYILELTTNAGCTAATTATVHYNPNPALGADQQLTPCDGNTIDLTALFNTSGLTTSWNSGGTPLGNPGQIVTSGLYELIAVNSFGCSDTATVTLSFLANPEPGADTSYDLCPWQTLDLTQLYPAGTNTATYFYNGQAYTNPQSAQDSGTYTVIFTNASGCSGSAQVIIQSVQCRCEADFDYTAGCMQDQGLFELKADSAILSVQWNFDGAAGLSTVTDPVVTFLRSGNVHVTATATLSCGVVEIKKEIQIEDCSDSCHIWIPSAFTPNNDEKNESFKWIGDCTPEFYTMDIYNRFGQQVFHTSDPENGWKADNTGLTETTSIYTYRIKVKMPYQDEAVLTGKLTVIR